MKKTKKKHWLVEIVNGVPEGMRHDTAVRLVGWLYYRGTTTGNVWNVLNEWNQLNSPPLCQQEIILIFQSTKKWGLPRVGSEIWLD
ncbi:primase C-terminal domain-containing protein [Chloroflexota bacterium]